jgi:hypothetical protein
MRSRARLARTLVGQCAFRRFASLFVPGANLKEWLRSWLGGRIARTLKGAARTISYFVIAGHGRSKNGVASRAYGPAIHAERPFAEIRRIV